MPVVASAQMASHAGLKWFAMPPMERIGNVREHAVRVPGIIYSGVEGDNNILIVASIDIVACFTFYHYQVAHKGAARDLRILIDALDPDISGIRRRCVAFTAGNEPDSMAGHAG